MEEGGGGRTGTGEALGEVCRGGGCDGSDCMRLNRQLRASSPPPTPSPKETERPWAGRGWKGLVLSEVGGGGALGGGLGESLFPKKAIDARFLKIYYFLVI